MRLRVVLVEPRPNPVIRVRGDAVKLEVADTVCHKRLNLFGVFILQLNHRPGDRVVVFIGHRTGQHANRTLLRKAGNCQQRNGGDSGWASNGRPPMGERMQT